jgi:toxin ParE1/3/4
VDYEIAWTEPAVADVDRILAFIAEQNPPAAEKLRDEILGSVKILQTFPNIGPIYRPDRWAATHQIVCKPYRVFYRVDEAARRVEILTVRHGSRAEPELPD